MICAEVNVRFLFALLVAVSVCALVSALLALSARLESNGKNAAFPWLLIIGVLALCAFLLGH